MQPGALPQIGLHGGNYLPADVPRRLGSGGLSEPGCLAPGPRIRSTIVIARESVKEPSRRLPYTECLSSRDNSPVVTGHRHEVDGPLEPGSDDLTSVRDVP